ncbi:MAG: Jag N-terminal domain-containing protein [Rubrobacter sp.]|nr:Jag N-terminal domain-containing protein [Rubrobacter sp.]
MSERREFNAATVEEAVKKASGALGTETEQLSYETIDTGSTGFLGIGARDARIVVETRQAESDSSRPQPDTPAVADDSQQEAEHDIEEPAGPTSTQTAPMESEPVEITPSPESPSPESPSPESPAAEAPPDLLEEVEAFAAETLNSMGFGGEAKVSDSGEVIAVDIVSEDTGLLIGQKGETIDAFQYLLNVAVYKHRPFVKKVIVDAEGYRQRRVEAVQGMAHRAARRAVRERQPVELPPMSSSERRAVHSYLKEDPKVETASGGSDENRRVTITPL